MCVCVELVELVLALQGSDKAGLDHLQAIALIRAIEVVSYAANRHVDISPPIAHVRHLLGMFDSLFLFLWHMS